MSATSGVPRLMEDAVSPEELAALRALPGGHYGTVADWLTGWRAQVVRFYSEMDADRSTWDDSTQHRHDWVGALHARAHVERCTREQSNALPASALAWLTTVDEFMRSFTVEAGGGWNPDAQPDGAWWWHRLPTHGPVKAGWWADVNQG